MPNQNNSSKNYDAGDLSNAYSLAESDMQWMNTAITHVNREIKRLHALAENGAILTQHHLSELITHLDMYEYLADTRKHYHAKQAETYELECNQSEANQ
jgi:uncharacterized protein YigA (DUF484 family)